MSRVDDYDSDGEQRCPRDRAFGQKAEREREIKNKEGRFPNRPRRSGDRRCLLQRWALKQFVSSPTRKSHEQYEPHVGDGGFRVNKCLERKRKYNCCPPPDPFSSDSPGPGENYQ